MGIPFIVVSQGKALESPTIFLTCFPFSNTFGSLFWSNIVGTKYTDLLDFTFHGKDNQRHKPVQLNGGLTSRILSAYLAHHQDDEGFILDPSLSPYKILTSEIDEKAGSSEMLRIVKELGLASKTVRGGRRDVMSKFTAMGTPLLAQQGKREINLTKRNGLQSEWVTEDNLREILIGQLRSQLNPEVSSNNKIEVVMLSEPLTHADLYSPDKVYTVDRQFEESLQSVGLKRIGYLDDNLACYVCRKY